MLALILFYRLATLLIVLGVGIALGPWLGLRAATVLGLLLIIGGALLMGDLP